MNDDFRRMHRQLGQGFLAMLCVAGVFLLLAFGAALLGSPHAVDSFKSAARASGYVAAVMATIYLSAHLFGATVQVIRWIRDRRAGRLS